MSKIAYINISDSEVQICISNDKTLKEGNFYKLELKDLSDFIKNKGIKKAFISQYLPNLLTLRFNLPFIKKKIKKKKILETIVKGEIKKRYPNFSNFSFTYNLHEGDGGNYLRCYVLDEDNFYTVNKLIMDGVSVEGFYPSFTPLVEFLKANEHITQHCNIIFFLSGKFRYVYVLQGDELILQRNFEGFYESLGEEDVININMTISYCIQNLRLKPEKVILLGTDIKELEGLPIPHEFIKIQEKFNDFLIPFCLFKFQKQLKGKELFLPEYRKYLSITKYTRYVFAFIILASILILFYNLYLFNEISAKIKELYFHRNEVAMKENEFFELMERINYFEKNISPFIKLQNKKNSQVDIKALIYPISEASQIKQVEIVSLELENKIQQKTKITGKISGNSFTERQTAYSNFKNLLIEKGFKILDEKWNIINGDFILEGGYEFQRILPK